MNIVIILKKCPHKLSVDDDGVTPVLKCSCNDGMVYCHSLGKQSLLRTCEYSVGDVGLATPSDYAYRHISEI